MYPSRYEFLLASSAETRAKSTNDRYREWNRKEVMEVRDGVKGRDDDGAELLLGGGIVALVVGAVVIMSWLKS